MKDNVFVNYLGDIGFRLSVEGSSDMEILENTFAKCNYGSGMEDPEFKRMKTRSLSVNDMVRVGDKWYQCLSCGWGEVSNDFVEELEKKVVEHPLFDEHGPWYALSQIMWEKKGGLV